ncbi:hypothetical protein E2C01_053973 [Portunus trituberculatus]|uniref:Uncharacterized protein n=1 Tax=Portunus trituberculatus TaxID=210409 RepID=A0A5B7GIN0_PORTR|nr:hypothetical protein [Portunus trituberculatus]
MIKTGPACCAAIARHSNVCFLAHVLQYRGFRYIMGHPHREIFPISIFSQLLKFCPLSIFNQHFNHSPVSIFNVQFNSSAVSISSL